jgi:hypothetical protein
MCFHKLFVAVSLLPSNICKIILANLINATFELYTKPT